MEKTVKKWIKPIYNLGKQLDYSVAGWLYQRGLFLNENFRQLRTYKDLHRGQRCFLVGTGPSLTASDLDLIAGIDGFGCNMLYKMYDKTVWRPTYYCMTDRVYARYQSEEMQKYVNVPIFTPKSTMIRMPQVGKQIIYVNDIYDYRTYRPRGKMLSYCWLKASVMLFMLEMAIYMGYEDIYLLGVDCSNTYVAGGHFTGDYTKKETRTAEQKRMEEDLKQKDLSPEEMWAHNYRRNIEAYEKIEKLTCELGIHVYNATRGGNLEIFPRVVLEDIV